MREYMKMYLIFLGKWKWVRVLRGLECGKDV